MDRESGFRQFAAYDLECQRIDGVTRPRIANPIRNSDPRRSFQMCQSSYSIAPDLYKDGFQTDAYFESQRLDSTSVSSQIFAMKKGKKDYSDFMK